MARRVVIALYLSMIRIAFFTVCLYAATARHVVRVLLQQVVVSRYCVIVYSSAFIYTYIYIKL